MNTKLTTKNSPVHGGGVFAVEPILAGETRVRWVVRFLPRKSSSMAKSNDQTACQIDDDLHIADSADHTELAGSDLMNHSCDPNRWMDDEVTISARRDIATGKEATADYAPWVAYPSRVAIDDCRCGSPLCRHSITGNDWQIPKLQERYKGHLPPCLTRRISRAL